MVSCSGRPTGIKHHEAVELMLTALVWLHDCREGPVATALDLVRLALDLETERVHVRVREHDGNVNDVASDLHKLGSLHACPAFDRTAIEEHCGGTLNQVSPRESEAARGDDRKADVSVEGVVAVPCVQGGTQNADLECTKPATQSRMNCG